MIEIKRLSECTLDQAVEAWNEGFKGYFFDSTMDVDTFTGRLGKEGLSSALSIVAFDEGKPIGLVVSGTRMIRGKKMAWNGGTGVAPEYRKQGVGRQLIEAALAIYREAGVDIATLEALSQNEKAIGLYEKMGYKVIDTLSIYGLEGDLSQNAFHTDQTLYHMHRGVAQEVQSLSYYHYDAAWQTQALGILNGECVIARDQDGNDAGYALYRRNIDEHGVLKGITLFQCVANPVLEDPVPVLKQMLGELYDVEVEGITRSTFNFPESNQSAVTLLRDAGFVVKNQQVNMRKIVTE